MDPQRDDDDESMSDCSDESLSYEEVMEMDDLCMMTEEFLKNGIKHAIKFDHNGTLFALMHAEAARDLGAYGRDLVADTVSRGKIEALSALLHSAYEIGHLAGIPNGPEVESFLNSLSSHKDAIDEAVRIIGLTDDVLKHICTAHYS